MHICYRQAILRYIDKGAPLRTEATITEGAPKLAASPQDPVENQDLSGLLLRTLIDSSFDGITVTSPEGRTIYYNKAFLRMSGVTARQMDSYSIYEIVKQGWLTKSAAIDVIRRKKTATVTARYHTGVEALITAVPVLDESGELRFVIGNVRDITELNRLKQELDDSEAMTDRYLATLKEVQLRNSGDGGIVYRSDAMEKIVALAQKYSEVDTPVLILGESGVGKDVLAAYVHNSGRRSDGGLFVKVNCGAIPEPLLESELFGYEAGAFTGAARQGKIGLFEAANGGTIFLDEIGELPLPLQVKLLGVLQDMRITRVGGTKPIPIDVRVIAATNADLASMIRDKRFREDLYFRINVLSLDVPPLRSRPDDVFVLLIHYLAEFNAKYGKSKSFAPSAVDSLTAYRWPGNVRELKNLVEQLAVVTDDDVIRARHLPARVREHKSALDCPDDAEGEYAEASGSDGATGGGTLDQLVGRFEAGLLSRYLADYRPMRACADKLGIDLSTLARKKRRYGL